MKIKRRKTRVIRVGRVNIGGNNPVVIQSMVKVKTAKIEDTLEQIREMQQNGCEIVRLAVKDDNDAQAIRKIKSKINIPIVADIHFDWRLALAAIDNGADKIRLNPGNIYKKEQIREIIAALKIARIPLRIGLNSGSVKGAQAMMAKRLVRSALDYIKRVEKLKFYDIIISLKASNILDTLTAYRQIAGVCDYPLHLGVTAAGLPLEGAVKSSLALGILLSEGIGDTLRVSLTGSPVEEVRVAKYILQSLGVRNFGTQIISCPTCGRCEVNLIKLVKEFQDKLSIVKSKPVKVALMGCVVNGPGEAKEADLGVAFGKKEGLLFKKGKIVKKISFGNCLKELLKELKGGF